MERKNAQNKEKTKSFFVSFMCFKNKKGAKKRTIGPAAKRIPISNFV